jgi:hypothetical protein
LAILAPGLYLNYFTELSGLLDQLQAAGEPITDEVIHAFESQAMPRYDTELIDPESWERQHHGRSQDLG